MMNYRHKFRTSAVITLALMALITAPVQAAQYEEGPGAALTVATWLVLSYLVLFLAALAAFLIALKRGMFHNIEEAKYYMLTIDEPDYYTPDWAKGLEDEEEQGETEEGEEVEHVPNSNR